MLEKPASHYNLPTMFRWFVVLLLLFSGLTGWATAAPVGWVGNGLTSVSVASAEGSAVCTAVQHPQDGGFPSTPECQPLAAADGDVETLADAIALLETHRLPRVAVPVSAAPVTGPWLPLAAPFLEGPMRPPRA
jgi:hypothetical protein